MNNRTPDILQPSQQTIKKEQKRQEQRQNQDKQKTIHKTLAETYIDDNPQAKSKQSEAQASSHQNQQQMEQQKQMIQQYLRFFKDIPTRELAEYEPALNQNKIWYSIQNTTQKPIQIKYSSTNNSVINVMVSISFFCFQIVVLNKSDQPPWCKTQTNAKQLNSNYDNNPWYEEILGRGTYGIAYSFANLQQFNVNQLHKQKIDEPLSYHSYHNAKDQPHVESANKFFALKLIKLHNRNLYSQTILEYCFQKLFSVLRIGPHTAPYLGFDLILYDKCVVFAMEQCRKVNEDLLDQSEIDICTTLKQSLKLMHSINIIHQDIKFENIMWSPMYRKFVFIDFGLSRCLKQQISQRSLVKYFSGTIAYADKQKYQLYKTKKQAYINLYYSDIYALDLFLKQLNNRTFDRYQGKKKDHYRNKDYIQFYFSLKICRAIYDRKLDHIVNLVTNYKINSIERSVFQLLQELDYSQILDQIVLYLGRRFLNRSEIQIMGMRKRYRMSNKINYSSKQSKNNKMNEREGDQKGRLIKQIKENEKKEIETKRLRYKLRVIQNNFTNDIQLNFNQKVIIAGLICGQEISFNGKIKKNNLEKQLNQYIMNRNVDNKIQFNEKKSIERVLRIAVEYICNLYSTYEDVNNCVNRVKDLVDKDIWINGNNSQTVNNNNDIDLGISQQLTLFKKMLKLRKACLKKYDIDLSQLCQQNYQKIKGQYKKIPWVRQSKQLQKWQKKQNNRKVCQIKYELDLSHHEDTFNSSWSLNRIQGKKQQETQVIQMIGSVRTQSEKLMCKFENKQIMMTHMIQQFNKLNNYRPNRQGQSNQLLELYTTFLSTQIQQNAWTKQTKLDGITQKYMNNYTSSKCLIMKKYYETQVRANLTNQGYQKTQAVIVNYLGRFHNYYLFPDDLMNNHLYCQIYLPILKYVQLVTCASSNGVTDSRRKQSVQSSKLKQKQQIKQAIRQYFEMYKQIRKINPMQRSNLQRLNYVTMYLNFIKMKMQIQYPSQISIIYEIQISIFKQANAFFHIMHNEHSLNLQNNSVCGLYKSQLWFYINTWSLIQNMDQNVSKCLKTSGYSQLDIEQCWKTKFVIEQVIKLLKHKIVSALNYCSQQMQKLKTQQKNSEQQKSYFIKQVKQIEIYEKYMKLQQIRVQNMQLSIMKNYSSQSVYQTIQKNIDLVKDKVQTILINQLVDKLLHSKQNIQHLTQKSVENWIIPKVLQNLLVSIIQAHTEPEENKEIKAILNGNDNSKYLQLYNKLLFAFVNDKLRCKQLDLDVQPYLSTIIRYKLYFWSYHRKTYQSSGTIATESSVGGYDKQFIGYCEQMKILQKQPKNSYSIFDLLIKLIQYNVRVPEEQEYMSRREDVGTTENRDDIEVGRRFTIHVVLIFKYCALYISYRKQVLLQKLAKLICSLSKQQSQCDNRYLQPFANCLIMLSRYCEYLEQNYNTLPQNESKVQDSQRQKLNEQLRKTLKLSSYLYPLCKNPFVRSQFHSNALHLCSKYDALSYAKRKMILLKRLRNYMYFIDYGRVFKALSITKQQKFRSKLQQLQNCISRDELVDTWVRRQLKREAKHKQRRALVMQRIQNRWNRIQQNKKQLIQSFQFNIQIQFKQFYYCFINREKIRTS